MQNQRSIRISKTLSWILRHKALDLGLSVGSDGFISVTKLLLLPQMVGVSLMDLIQIVSSNDKKRFELLERESGEWFIRATQGHSKNLATAIEDTHLLTKLMEPLDVCVHGTYFKYWESIRKEGLNRMNRQHIHFAPGLPKEVGVTSGMRGDCQVLIY